MGLITLLQMNEYCQLKIEYLWNAVDLKKTEHSDSLIIKFSIPTSAFPIPNSLD